MNKKRALTDRMATVYTTGPAVTVTASDWITISMMQSWLEDRDAVYQSIGLDRGRPTSSYIRYRTAWHIEDDSERMLFAIAWSDYISRGPAVTRSSIA